MHTKVIRLLTSFFLLGFLAATGFAQTAAGVIKAARITGSVNRVTAAGVQSPLTDGTVVAETDTIVTGANSGLVLVFMNGSSVKLGANSRLLIEEFKMDPLDRDIAVGELKAEPSKSKTSLNLAYGDLVGDVKKLNKSSSYNIKTPVGAAGIRGTQFRIVLTPSADGKSYSFSLSTAEGLVQFTVPSGSESAPVGASTEIVLTAEVDTSGKITSTKVETQGISTANASAIETAVTTAAEATKVIVITTTDQQQAATGSGTGGTGGTGGNSGGTDGTGGNSGNDTAGAQGNTNTGTQNQGNPLITGTTTPATVSPR